MHEEPKHTNDPKLRTLECENLTTQTRHAASHVRGEEVPTLYDPKGGAQRHERAALVAENLTLNQSGRQSEC